jgi:ornithine--oxo-acid transaminase
MATPLDLAHLLSAAAEEATDLHARHGNLAFVELLESTGNGIECVRGSGPYLWERSGRRILDCMAGYGAVAIGRGHPIVMDALRQCIEGDSAGWVRWELAPLAGQAAKELVRATDGRARRVFFTNSGTEAMEAAIKYARRATGRPGLLGREHSTGSRAGRSHSTDHVNSGTGSVPCCPERHSCPSATSSP